MFPIRDHNPSRRTPYVTWSLIAINVAVFASYWHLFDNDYALAQFFYQWGLVPAVARPETFVTSMFLHGGLMHIAGNMLFLWVFGDNLEDAMGHAGFLVPAIDVCVAQVGWSPDDLDAIVVDVIANPISIWEAMIAPFVRIRDTVAERVSAMIGSKATELEGKAASATDAKVTAANAIIRTSSHKGSATLSHMIRSVTGK